jgi:hypothetical protein
VIFRGPAVAVLVTGAYARGRPHNASLPSLQDGTPQHMSQWESTQDMVAYKLGLSLVVRMRAAEDAPQPCLPQVPTRDCSHTLPYRTSS